MNPYLAAALAAEIGAIVATGGPQFEGYETERPRPSGPRPAPVFTPPPSPKKGRAGRKQRRRALLKQQRIGRQL